MLTPLRLFAIAVILVAATLGWFVLGGSVAYRTETSGGDGTQQVGSLWGQPQVQSLLFGQTEMVLPYELRLLYMVLAQLLVACYNESLGILLQDYMLAPPLESLLEVLLPKLLCFLF